MDSDKTNDVTIAAKENLEAMAGLEFLRQEAAKGKRDDFERYLEAIPDEPAVDQ